MDNIIEEARNRYNGGDKNHPICPYTKRILWDKKNLVNYGNPGIEHRDNGLAVIWHGYIYLDGIWAPNITRNTFTDSYTII